VFLGHARHRIWADRTQRPVLTQRRVVLRHDSIFLRRSDRQDAAGRSVPMYCLEQIQEDVGVVLEAVYGMLPAIADGAVGGQVDGEVGAYLLDQRGDSVRMEEIQCLKREPSWQHDAAGRQIRADNVSIRFAAQYVVDQIASNETGAAREQV